jgi:hypothetical protein
MVLIPRHARNLSAVEPFVYEPPSFTVENSA